jgi:hypothetical protein
MATTTEATAKTRAFARVIGPFVLIAASITAVRAPSAGPMATAFFQNPALVWIVGGILLLAGLVIISQHQIWSSVSAVLVSLFGWFLALRGLVLLAFPQTYAQATAASVGATTMVRIFFGVLVLIAVWLTYAGWIAKRT